MCSTGSDIKYTVVMVGVLVMTVVTVVAVTVMVVNMPVMVLMVQVMRAETAGMMVVVMVGLMVVDMVVMVGVMVVVRRGQGKGGAPVGGEPRKSGLGPREGGDRRAHAWAAKESTRYF